MRQLSNSKIINTISLLLIMIAVAKLISLVILYFLPKSGVEVIPANANNVKYRSYRVSPLFDLNVTAPGGVKGKDKPVRNALKIDSLILHAIYGDNVQGFIVFAEKSSPQDNHIIALKQSYKGYKLVRIRQVSAILEKGGKNYEITFKEAPNRLPIQKRIAPPKAQKHLGDTNVLRAVRKKDVMHYAKNYKEIWKNIAIKEVKRDGKINGFKVMSVKRSSIFAQLGLVKGDIIMSVNNQELKSYADAFKIYKNIDDYDSLKLVIIRNKQKKELEYEVF